MQKTSLSHFFFQSQRSISDQMRSRQSPTKTIRRCASGGRRGRADGGGDGAGEMEGGLGPGAGPEKRGIRRRLVERRAAAAADLETGGSSSPSGDGRCRG